MVGTSGAVRNGVLGQGAQGALLRRGLLPDGSRDALVADLADGVPPGGDPPTRRLRRVRSPRSVGCRGAVGRHDRAGVPERLPAPWRQGRAGSGNLRGHLHLPVSRVVLRPGRDEHVRHPVQDVRRAQPGAAGPEPRAGALRDVGRMRLDQPRQRCSAAAGVHRAVRHGHGCLESGVAADGEVVRVPSSGELEAGRRGLHGAVPRRGDPPPARDQRPGCFAHGWGRIREQSSTRRSTTCTP